MDCFKYQYVSICVICNDTDKICEQIDRPRIVFTVLLVFLLGCLNFYCRYCIVVHPVECIVVHPVDKQLKQHWSRKFSRLAAIILFNCIQGLNKKHDITILCTCRMCHLIVCIIRNMSNTRSIMFISCKYDFQKNVYLLGTYIILRSIYTSILLHLKNDVLLFSMDKLHYWCSLYKLHDFDDQVRVLSFCLTHCARIVCQLRSTLKFKPRRLVPTSSDVIIVCY